MIQIFVSESETVTRMSTFKCSGSSLWKSALKGMFTISCLKVGIMNFYFWREDPLFFLTPLKNRFSTGFGK